MPTLLYKGYNSDGRNVRGSKSFANEDQMKDYLQQQGITDYEIFESKTAYKTGMYSLVSTKELSIFCKQMTVLFISQITLMEGILVLAEQSENKQLKLALEEIYSFMDRGYTFAESISMYEHIFTRYMLDMIIIGETGGTLDTVLNRLADYLDKENRIRKKIRTAVTYPAVLTALMAVIVIILVVKILPMFRDILESMGTDMPTATKLILNTGVFLAKFAPVIIIVVVVAVVAFFLYIRSKKGRMFFDKAKLSIPAYRYVNSRIITSRFARSMSILLKSGVQLLNALSDVSVLMDNKYLEAKLADAVKKVREDADPADVFKELGIFPALFIRMFVIGQRTGNIDEMLDRAAAVFDDETDDAFDKLASMLEPFLIIVLSIIVGTILISVILPMINIMNAIG